MPSYIINYELPDGKREYKRRCLIQEFLKEVPGTGVGDSASRYQYNVESFGDYGIFLKRPTQLNKGFDFTVNIHGVFFKKSRRYSNPSHQDICTALYGCKMANPSVYTDIEKAIVNIYDCCDFDFSQINAGFFDYEGRTHPIQVILLAIKWLFMEQDCAYWNYSGRKMFFDKLQQCNLL